MMLDEPHATKATYGYATAGWVSERAGRRQGDRADRADAGPAAGDRQRCGHQRPAGPAAGARPPRQRSRRPAPAAPAPPPAPPVRPPVPVASGSRPSMPAAAHPPAAPAVPRDLRHEANIAGGATLAVR